MPIDVSQLPSYLPAPPPPQVNVYIVFKKIEKLKNTKSTLPMDLPNKLRKDFSVELAEPLTNIINVCLNQQSMSATSVERVSSPNRFAELQLTGIEPATLVTGPSNSTTELRP